MGPVNMTNSRTMTIALLLSATAACSYMPFSGGALTGTPAPPLADWRTVGGVSIIQLETRPSDPYSVKLWMVAEENHLYVFAGDNHSQWAQNLDAIPDARLQVEDNVYQLAAVQITDQQEFRRFADAWLEKYGSDHTETNVDDVYLYRLTPRQ